LPLYEYEIYFASTRRGESYDDKVKQPRKTSGRIIQDELHRGREDQAGYTTECACMSRRVEEDEMEGSPL